MKEILKEWLQTIGFALLLVVVSIIIGVVISIPIIGLLALLTWLFKSKVVALCILTAIAFICMVLFLHNID